MPSTSAIDNALLRQADLSDITATYVLERIRAVADDPKARNVDRLRALELVGKHPKLFTDRVEQDTQITVTIERIG